MTWQLHAFSFLRYLRKLLPISVGMTKCDRRSFRMQRKELMPALHLLVDINYLGPGPCYHLVSVYQAASIMHVLIMILPQLASTDQATRLLHSAVDSTLIPSSMQVPRTIAMS